MSVGVKILRQMLHDAALRFAALRDLESGLLLESVAEQFGVAKRRARVRREKWRERQEEKEAPVGDGVTGCRVEGCKKEATHRPTLLFKPDEGEDPIRVETAMLDVCEEHARNLDTEVFTNGAIWEAIAKTWEDNGLERPDPSSLIEVQYAPILKVTA